MDKDDFTNLNVNAIIKKVLERFKSAFEIHPDIIVTSPGRINIIGEHTDYNDGFVLPAAIDKYIVFALSKRNDTECKLYSIDFNDFYQFNLNEIKRSEKTWANYLIGVINEIKQIKSIISGFNCAFSGNIPIGAGLSSSAALECGLAYAFNELFDLSVDKLTLAKLCQRAENDFVGVRCGIMDQFVNLFGKENAAIMLDTRNLKYEVYSLHMNNCAFVIADSKIKRELSSSEYNLRRKQCEMVVGILQKYNPEIKALRDVTIELLDEFKEEINKNDPFCNNTLYKRAKFVIEENERVLKTCEYLTKGDIESIGKLMYDSHIGLRDLYEVSCQELDLLTDIALEGAGALGARMMGAGFGGSTINLVFKDELEDFISNLKTKYHNITGKNIEVYIVNITNGTSKANISF
jgi:galactokinase